MRAWSRVLPFTLAVILLVNACSGGGNSAFKGLSDDDALVRAQAAMDLGRAKTPGAVDALIGALDDPDEGVRVNVIRALGQIGDAKAVPPILPYGADRLSAVRLATCQALGDLHDPRGVPALEKLLYDEDETARIVAAKGLGSIPGPESLEVLVRVALMDDSEFVRSHVVKVIGARRSRDAVPKLESALQAESDLVRANAAKVLGLVGDRSSLPALTRALSDPYGKVRSLAAHSIADVVGKGTPDPAAMEGIRARLAIETEGMARVDMAWSLVRMGDRSEVEILRTLLRTGEPEDVRAEAAIGLGELGDPAEIPALEKALKDKKGLVRMRAAEAINKINGVEPS